MTIRITTAVFTTHEYERSITLVFHVTYASCEERLN
jgi:hypothetical protein